MDNSPPPPPRKWWRRIPMDASGILRVDTAFLPAGATRRFRQKPWRPPGWLIFSLLAFALLFGTGAAVHRRLLEGRLAGLVREAAPFEIKRIQQDLAEKQLDQKALSAELDARLKYARSQKEHEFYILLDAKRQRFAFKYGDRVVREFCFDAGAARVVHSKNRSRWTFAPVTGAFSVTQKLEDADRTVPPWVYALNGEEPPRTLPIVPGGLGSYVLLFSEGYAIHSPPPPESPLQGPKPGSFMVPEADLAAIWRRVGPGTRVYVF